MIMISNQRMNVFYCGSELKNLRTERRSLREVCDNVKQNATSKNQPFEPFKTNLWFE